ncbi:MAG TPA: hypothetical protein ACHBX0_11960 [Arsenophonus sp.]
MSSDQFDKVVKDEWNRIAPTLNTNYVKYGNSYLPVFQLKNYRESEYLIIHGSGPLRNKNDHPVIIDFSQEKIRDVPL